jgi:pSer/pThr/pTyr-binding forkhead associated (FHA) protein
MGPAVTQEVSMKEKKDHAETTQFDPSLGRRRLKEGLVKPDTGIFLRIEQGSGKGRTFVLSPGGVYLIGREGADIDLDDDKVSRKHAEIGLYGPGAFVLRDLASTNGTRLNGKRISEKASLKHWDEIRVGDTLLRFSVVEGSVRVAS